MLCHSEVTLTRSPPNYIQMRNVAKKAFRRILYSVSAYGALFALASLLAFALAPALGFAAALDFATGLVLGGFLLGSAAATSFGTSVDLLAATNSR